MAHHEVSPVEAERHLGGCGGSLQGRDLRIGGAVENQHLVQVLAHHIEAPAHGVGQDIGQSSGNVDKRAALIGVVVVDEQAYRGRKIYRRGGADRELRREVHVVLQRARAADAAEMVVLGIRFDRQRAVGLHVGRTG